MAGYPKIWTTIESESWFQACDLARRGAILQFIIWCKKDGDTGHLEFRSWRFLAERLGCHHDTCHKFVSDLARLGFLTVETRDNGTIHIFLPKYKKSQDVTSYKKMVEDSKEVAKSDAHLANNLTEPNRTEAIENKKEAAAKPPLQYPSKKDIIDQWLDYIREIQMRRWGIIRLTYPQINILVNPNGQEKGRCAKPGFGSYHCLSVVLENIKQEVDDLFTYLQKIANDERAVQPYLKRAEEVEPHIKIGRPELTMKKIKEAR